MSDQIHVNVVNSYSEPIPQREPEPVRRGVDWAQLVVGLVFALLGVLCLAAPAEMLKGLVAVVGVAIVLAAVAVAVVRFRASRILKEVKAYGVATATNVSYAAPIFVALAGLLLIVSPALGMRMFGILAGLLAIGLGGFTLLTSGGVALLSFSVGSAVGLTGLLGIVIGVLMIIFPQYLAVLFGLFLLVQAVSVIISALPVSVSR